MFGELPEEVKNNTQKNIDNRNVAMVNLLAIELALISFHAKNDGYPSDLSQLVPECIAAIPADPFMDAAFVFRKNRVDFDLYSPGPTGRDSSGSFGDWLNVQTGLVDLCL
ncbi:MAG: hypothetical protein ACI9HK_000587, partial [Pirellulaceae bacterium]